MELNHDVPRIRLLNVNPLVGILENFTDAQTSAAITEFASQKLKVATVHINGESVVKPNVRTGQLSWAKHGELPALDEMRARIARILRIDAAYCEQVQLVKYTSSEQYVPHFDSFHFAADKYPANIRNQADIGGGALYDIGCYPIVTARLLFGCEPVRAIALVERDPEFKTDRLVSALVDFGQGRRLDFTVSTQSVPYQRVQVCGTAKRIEVQIPFNAPLGGSTQIFTDDGSQLDGGSVHSETIAACDQYGLQGDAFSRAIRGEIALPYSVEDAIANMRVIDALFASEKTGAWVTI